MELPIDEIRDVLRALESAPFQEIRLEVGELKLVVRRHGGAEESPPLAETTEQVPVPTNTGEIRPSARREVPSVIGSTQATELPQDRSVSPAAEPTAADASCVAITAPMIGTFYRAPSPGAPPFVEVGDFVTPTTTVGIIDVMKVMNSLPAGASGVVTAILVEDAQLVEFGQPIVLVRPAGLPPEDGGVA